MCRKCCHTISPAAVIRWSRTWWKKTFVVILILCLFYIFFRAMCWHWTKQTQQQLLIQYAETAIKWMCCISDMSIFFRSSYNRKLYKITIAYASNGNKKEQDMTETERTSRVNFFRDLWCGTSFPSCSSKRPQKPQTNVPTFLFVILQKFYSLLIKMKRKREKNAFSFSSSPAQKSYK